MGNAHTDKGELERKRAQRASKKGAQKQSEMVPSLFTTSSSSKSSSLSISKPLPLLPHSQRSRSLHSLLPLAYQNPSKLTPEVKARDILLTNPSANIRITVTPASPTPPTASPSLKNLSSSPKPKVNPTKKTTSTVMQRGRTWIERRHQDCQRWGVD